MFKINETMFNEWSNRYKIYIWNSTNNEWKRCCYPYEENCTLDCIYPIGIYRT